MAVAPSRFATARNSLCEKPRATGLPIICMPWWFSARSQKVTEYAVRGAGALRGAGRERERGIENRVAKRSSKDVKRSRKDVGDSR